MRYLHRNLSWIGQHCLKEWKLVPESLTQLVCDRERDSRMSLYACVLVCSAVHFSEFEPLSIFGGTRANVCAFMRGGWQESEIVSQRHALYARSFVYVNILKCVYVWFLCAKCMSERVCVGGVGVWLWNMCIVCVGWWMGGWLVCVYAEIRELCLFLSDSKRETYSAERGGNGEEMDARTHTHLNTQLVQWAISQMEASNGYALIKQTSARIESNLVWLRWFCFVIVEFKWNQNWFFLMHISGVSCIKLFIYAQTKSIPTHASFWV